MSSTVKRIFSSSYSLFCCSMPAFLFFILLLLFVSCKPELPDSKIDSNESLLPPYRVHFAQKSSDTIYLATYAHGLLKRVNGTEVQLLNSEFKRRSMLDDVDEFRKVTAFALMPGDSDRIAVALKHVLYETEDGGIVWKKQMGDFDPHNYITALGYTADGTLYVGTSFDGIFKREEDSFIRFSKGLSLEPYSERVVFYDPVARIREVDGVLYLSQYFNKGVCRLEKDEWVPVVINLPGEDPAGYVADFESSKADGSAGTDKTELAYSYSVANSDIQIAGFNAETFKREDFFGGELVYTDSGFSLFAPDSSLPVREDLKDAAHNKQAIYTNVHYVVKGLDRLIRIIKESGMNSLVIDVKDDYGDVYGPFTNETSREIGALKTSVNLKPVLKRLHDEGIYAIARIVVFKDKRLHDAYDNKYTIRDSALNRPWRYGRERWVDPFSEFVRSYNIQLAVEAEQFGFNEIQFDYIRFPADGPVKRCDYTYSKHKDAFKSEAMDDFLQQATEALTVPVSVDIYGITASYNFGNRIGQDIEVFAKHVDAVSSMVYPSHYGPRYMMKGPREKRPYRVVYDSGVRSLFLSRTKVYMRPYLQAFMMDSPTFGTGYIQNQVDAVHDSGCDGFIFWHAGGKYDVVRRALSNRQNAADSTD
ncbi:MAG: hypothetical protein PF637_00200 [Spirochaetes bacterium]|jgi:hypothetical protein|nr:hypothetical protein [Spirochaetota bacterium]